MNAKRLKLAVICLAISGAAACNSGDGAMPDSGITTLQTTDVKPGTGAEARPGMTVRVHYTGWLYDAGAANRRGRQFDTSKESGEPFEFRLGAGEVIAGWDEGVAGMRTGGTRVLTVPPGMAYGNQGVGEGLIPPNATLVFEVELLEVK